MNADYHEGHKSPLTKLYRLDGYDVYLAPTPRIARIEEHADILGNYIESNIPKNKKLLLIGHSQGGLVIRQYAHNESQLRQGRKITNVITIGTPHRGTLPRNAIIGEEKIKEILRKEHPLYYDGVRNFFDSGMQMVGEEIMEWNERVPNVPGIDYASVSSVDNRFYLTLPNIGAYKILRDLLIGSNDGLVPVESAHWGRRIHINGTVSRANHASQMYYGFGDNLTTETIAMAVKSYTDKFLRGELPVTGNFNYRGYQQKRVCLSLLTSLLLAPGKTL